MISTPLWRYIGGRDRRAIPPNAGLTLIEVLLAIVMTGIVLAAIAPVLALSAATRIQNRQLEQAYALAQQEVDRVQAAMAGGVPQDEEAGIVPPEVSYANYQSTGAPSDTKTDRAELTSSDALVVDVDSDGATDFFVQVFRDEGVRFTTGTGENQLGTFRMTVRVYSSRAESNLLADNLEDTVTASSTLTSRLEQWATSPLIVTQSEISRSDLELSLDVYRQYLLCTSNPSLDECS